MKTKSNKLLLKTLYKILSLDNFTIAATKINKEPLLIKIKELEYINFIATNELLKCQDQTRILENIIIDKEDIIKGLNDKVKTNIDLDAKIISLKKDIACLEEKNTNLTNELSKVVDDNLYTLHKQKSEYEKIISELNYRFQMVNHKYESIKNFDEYHKIIEEYNKDMTEKYNNAEKEINRQVNIEKERFFIKNNDVKKNCVLNLDKAKQTIEKSCYDKIEGSVKLTMLQNNQLYTEVTEQSKVIERLIGELDKKDILIKNLQLEIELQKGLGRLVTAHNKNLSRKVGSISNNIVVINDANNEKFEKEKIEKVEDKVAINKQDLNKINIELDSLIREPNTNNNNNNNKDDLDLDINYNIMLSNKFSKSNSVAEFTKLNDPDSHKLTSARFLRNKSVAQLKPSEIKQEEEKKILKDTMGRAYTTSKIFRKFIHNGNNLQLRSLNELEKHKNEINNINKQFDQIERKKEEAKYQEIFSKASDSKKIALAEVKRNSQIIPVNSVRIDLNNKDSNERNISKSRTIIDENYKIKKLNKLKEEEERYREIFTKANESKKIEITDIKRNSHVIPRKVLSGNIVKKRHHHIKSKTIADEYLRIMNS